MAQPLHISRLVIAGSGSGVGKTTIAVGLIRALRARGLKVAAFKCGPDYLDPTYHARATGAASHNLDGWMMGRDSVLATFTRASGGADLAVIEGMMGLFDGASATGEEGSTAEIAKWLEAPVLLVLDAAGMARSAAAVVRGFAEFDRELNVAGLICNRIGSRAHLELLQQAISSPPILGGLPDEAALAFEERHLGLRTAEARVDSIIAALGALVADWFDLDSILERARAAPVLSPMEEIEPRRVQARCRIGIAFDEAFHFYYEDNLRRLELLGAELVRFSPLRDQRLPDVDGLYLGGGYPEVHAEALSANKAMLAQLRAFAARAGPIYAECGGLMYLTSGIRTLDGRLHEMAGLLPGEAAMRDRLQALGYVEVQTRGKSLLGTAGLRFRGHQFRYSDLLGVPDDVERIYSVRRPRGGEAVREGYRKGSVLASYVHAHWASNHALAEGLVEACATHGRSAGWKP